MAPKKGRGPAPATDASELLDVVDEEIIEEEPEVKSAGKKKKGAPTTFEGWWKNWGKMVEGATALEPFRQLVKTGVMSIDVALGHGGMPLGGVTTVYGYAGTGKTTLAMTIAGAVQRQYPEKRIIYVDGENKLNPFIANLNGLTMNEELMSDGSLMLIRPSLLNGYSYERMMMSIEQIARPEISPAGVFVVVDSLDSLMTQSELEQEADDGGSKFGGGMAKSNSTTMRRMVGILKATDSSMLVIQQGRVQTNTMGFGPPKMITSGGKAIENYSSIRIELKKGEGIKVAGSNVGNVIYARLVKNNFHAAEIRFDWELRYDNRDWNAGIDTSASLLDVAATLGYVKKGGEKSYEIVGFTKKDGEPAVFGNGREATLKWLRTNPEQFAALEAKVRKHLFGDA